MLWETLKTYTNARIGLGNCGSGLPTKEWLSFKLAHAQAKDAVWKHFNVIEVMHQLEENGLPSVMLETEATDTNTFLLRPDLGRKLSLSSQKTLESYSKDPSSQKPRITIMLSSGLSSIASETNGIATLIALKPYLQDLNVDSFLPVFVLPRARVGLTDHVGSILKSDLALMLIGERPGLDCADSLGAYITYNPQIGNTDAHRNCISNIHIQGCTPEVAAYKIYWLLKESLRLKLSGVRLKDESHLNDPLLKG